MPENNTIELTLNGQAYTTEATHLAPFLQQLEDSGNIKSGYAVAINRNFVPKIQYADVALNTGDDIEILSPMQGG